MYNERRIIENIGLLTVCRVFQFIIGLALSRLYKPAYIELLYHKQLHVCSLFPEVLYDVGGVSFRKNTLMSYNLLINAVLAVSSALSIAVPSVLAVPSVASSKSL